MKKSLVLAGLAVMVWSGVRAHAEDVPGNPGWSYFATNFNAVVFGDFTAAGGDTEGRLAVCGTATFSSGYSVGMPVAGLPLPTYTNATIDILIVGGDLHDGAFGVNGNIVHGGTRYGPYRWMPDGNVVEQVSPPTFGSDGNVPRDGSGETWQELHSRACSVSAALGALPDSGVARKDFSSPWQRFLTGTNLTLNVFNVTAAAWSMKSSQVVINAPSGSTVLVNIAGDAVAITNSSIQLVGVDRRHVLYNYPSATWVSTKSFLHRGSVLAPYASAALSGGAVDGTAVFGGDVTTTIGFEFHNFPFFGSMATPSVNEAPVVDAGSDFEVFLGFERNLSGTVSDDGHPSEGALVASWSVETGDATAVDFADETNPATTVRFLAAGTYSLLLTASDGALSTTDSVAVTVNPIPNRPPVVDAGPDWVQPTFAPVALKGSVADDGMPAGASVTTHWLVTEGEAADVVIADATATNSAITFTAEGDFVLRLMASDTQAAAHDTVNITVRLPNEAPSVDAGADQMVFVGALTPLSGRVLDDGKPASGILATQWSVLSGTVSAVEFVDNSAPATQARFTQAGTYVLRLSATDGELECFDSLTLTVAPVPNQPPIVDAGSDQVVSLYATCMLFGSVSDDGLPDGDIESSVWTQVEGPGASVVENPEMLSPVVRFSVPGCYRFKLEASDGALTASDETAVHVTLENQPPVVDAGMDRDIVQGTRALLQGRVVDDGLPVGGAASNEWLVVSGPGQAVFERPDSATTSVQVSTPGEYGFQLRFSDGELEASDEVVIRFGPPPNHPPSVDAGSDREVDFSLVRTDNLIVNPGAEINATNGVVFGWTQVVATWLTPTATSLGLTTVEGYSVFRPSASQAAELQQDVDVSLFSDPIDAGRQLFEFSVSYRVAEQVRYDEPRVRVEYRSEAGDVLATSDISPTPLSTNWGLLADTRMAPRQTRSIRVRLIAENSGINASNDVFFDAVTLRGVELAPVFIRGSVSDDGLPEAGELNWSWRMVSGPVAAIFEADSSLDAKVFFSAPGTYELALNANDGESSAEDHVMVSVVDHGGEQPLCVDAGTNQVVNLPLALAQLDGAVQSSSTNALTVSWAEVSGNAHVFIENGDTLQPRVRFYEFGEYTLRLSVSDGREVAYDEVQIVVAMPQALQPMDVVMVLDRSGSMSGDRIVNAKLAAQQFVQRLMVGDRAGVVAFADSAVVLQELTFEHDAAVAAIRPIHAGGGTTIHQGIAAAAAHLAAHGRLDAEWVIVLLSDGGSSYPLALAASQAAQASGIRMLSVGLGSGTDERLMCDVASSRGDYFFAATAADLEPLYASLSRSFCRFGEAGLEVYAGPSLHLPRVEAVGELMGRVAFDLQSMPDSAVSSIWSVVSGPGDVSFGNPESAVTTVRFSMPGTYVLALTAKVYAAGKLEFEKCRFVTAVVDQPSEFSAPEGLVALWRGEGNTLDSISNFHGVEPTGLDYTNGPNRLGFALSGQNGGIEVPTFGQLNVGASTNGFSVGFWTKVKSTLGEERVIGCFDDQNGIQFGIRKRSAISRNFEIALRTESGATITQVTETGTYLVDTWHHYACVYDRMGGVMRFYRDGLILNRYDNMGNLACPTTGTFWFGSNPGKIEGLNGGLDEICVFNRPLSPDEIWRLAQDSAPAMVVPSGNAAPQVDAGADSALFSCDDRLSLQGFASDDGLPIDSLLHTTWSKLSGPGEVVFDEAASLSPTVSFSESGIYILKLAADDGILASYDTVRVVVDGAAHAVVPPCGLRAHWPAEGTGREVVGGFDAEPVGGVSYVPARVGSGFDHDAKGMMLAPTKGNLNAGASTNGFSVEFWARMDSYGTEEVLAGWYDAAGAQFSVVKKNSISCYFAVTFRNAEGGVTTTQTAANTYGVGQWQHFVFTYHPATGTLAIYRNGVFFQTLSFPAGGFQTTGDFCIGGRTGSSVVLNGAMDEVSVYDRCLQPDEVWAVYEAPDGKAVMEDNAAPTVFAGPDRVVASVVDDLMLEGQVGDDGRPTSRLQVQWTQVTGPANVLFDDPATPRTSVRFEEPGIYLLKLSANDGAVFSHDTVRIEVAWTNSMAPPCGLRAHWPAEGTGREVVGGFDAEPVGGVSYVPARVGTGFDHDAKGMMLAPTKGNLNAGVSTNGFSVEFWARMDSYGTEEVLAGWYDAAGAQFSVVKRNSVSRYFAVVIRNAEGVVSTTQTTPYTYGVGTWQHFVFTYHPATGTLTIYRNGVFFQTLSLPAGGFTTTGDFCIGGRTGSSGALNGAMDEVSVYDRMLNAAEIAMLHAIGKVVILANQPPRVFAGYPAVYEDVLEATLSGMVSDDGCPTNSALMLEWTQIAGPAEAEFLTPSELATDVTVPAYGCYTFRLSVSDGEFSASSDVVIELCSSTPANIPPTVNAGEPQEITLPTAASLAGVATDPDNGPQPLVTTWSRATGPAEVVFADASSPVTTATFSAPGVYLLRLSATDGEATVLSHVAVVVNPHVANAAPIVDAGEGVAVSQWAIISLAGAASDDGIPNPLETEWTMLSGPAPALIETPRAINSRVQFTYLGTYVLQLRAFDGEKQSLDTVAYTVVDPSNQPPLVDAGDSVSGIIGEAVPLSPSVSDDGLPDGRISLAWRCESGMGGCEWSRNARGDVVATFSKVGDHVLKLTATDGEYAVSDTCVVSLTAPGREGPSVSLTSPAEGRQLSAGDSLLLEAEASDPDGSIAWVSFYADDLCLGSVTNGTPYRWVWNNLVPGAHTIAAIAFNEIGQRNSTDAVTIQVMPVEPGITLAAPLAGSYHLVGQPIFMQAALRGAAAFDAVEFLVDGVSIATRTAPPYVAAYSPATSGTIQLQARALVGGAASLVSDSVSVNVVASTGEPPVVSISAPVHGGTVTSPTDITGTVYGGNLAAYRLQIRSCSDAANDDAWQTLDSGTAPLGATGSPAKLGTLDPTLLRNGAYELRVIATDLFGASHVEDGHSIVLDGGMKVGQFQLSFEDLNIPLAGIPVQLLRSYDSRGTAAADFGPDWELGFRSVQVQTSAPVGSGWEDYVTRRLMGIPFYGIRPIRRHVVSVLIGEDVQQFEAYSPTEQGFFPLDNAAVAFRPINGSLGTLSLQAADMGNRFVTRNGDEVQLMDIASLDALDPKNWVYTTPDGTRLDIQKIFGLRKLTDRNANSLTFSAAGVTHSSGESIAFTRDDAGRVTVVTTPDGATLHYEYDAFGYLAAFVNRAGETTRFDYVAHPAYPESGCRLLQNIIDPLGNRALAAGYDDDGRLVRQTDAAGHAVAFTHDIPNRRHTVTDRLGHVTIHEYDLRGNIVRTVDALGYVTTRAYDAFDNEVSVTDPLGNTTTYTYDAKRNKLTETDALGNTTSTTYSESNQPLMMIDALGNTTAFAYDANGNVTSMTDALGRATTFAYNGNGDLLSMTDVTGNSTVYAYDSHGRVISTVVTDATGGVCRATSSAYDSRGNQIATIALRTVYGNDGTVIGREAVTNRYEYDSEGRVTQTIHPDGTTSETEYNAAGKEIRTVDALGLATENAYDAKGNLIRTDNPDGTFTVWSYDAEDHQISENRYDAVGNLVGASSTEYDALGRQVSVVQADSLDASGQPVGSAESTVYDEIGRIVITYDARDNATVYEYDPACGSIRNSARVIDALGNITDYEYDGNGNKTAVIDASGYVTEFTYDGQNRPVCVTHPDGTTTETVYDAGGRRSAVIDELGRRTDYTYDSLGRLVEVLQPAPAAQDPRPSTRYAYNESGNRIAQTDALGRTTRYRYDCMGRRIARILPGGEVESCTYNAVGQLSARTDFNNYTTTYDYDAYGRLVEESADPTHPSLSLAHAAARNTYAFDASGRPVYSCVWNGEDDLLHEETLAYDLAGRLVQAVTSYGTLAYDYDDAGNLTGVTSGNADGTALEYAYDVLNRLQTVYDFGSSTSILEHAYAYTPVGSLESVAYANGVTHTYAYNGRNRLTGLQINDAQATLLNSFGYQLNAVGHRTRIDEANGRTRLFQYDNLNRLTSEQILGDAVGVNGTVEYVHDLVGNRIASASTLPGVVSQSNSYSVNDRLDSDTCDDNGNTVAASGITAGDVYDAWNRLIRRTKPDGTVVDLGYDHVGNRVSKTVSTATNETFTAYLVDNNSLTGYAQVLEELREDGLGGLELSRTYAVGHDVISQTTHTPTYPQTHTRYFLYDGQGSVWGLADESGTVTDYYAYDAFGVHLYDAGAGTPNLFRYTGEQFDTDLGQYYLRARYYEPTRGRFWTQDSYEGSPSDPISLHKYLYANASPVMYVDPNGSFSVFEMQCAISVHAQMLSIRVASTFPAIYATSKMAAKVISAAMMTANLGLFFADEDYRGTVMSVPGGIGMIEASALSLSRMMQSCVGFFRVTALTTDGVLIPAHGGTGRLITLYRGVSPHRNAPQQFAEAVKGTATPYRPIFGHSDPNLHNAWNTKSKFVSWTKEREIAKRFAGQDGVILEIRADASCLIPTPDKYGEAEFLIQGQIQGAKVTLP